MQNLSNNIADFRRRYLPVIFQYRLVFVLIGLFVAVLALYESYNNKAYGIYAQDERERLAVENVILPAWERKTETDKEMRLGLMGELRIELENNYTFASDIEDRYTAVPDYLRPLAFFRAQMQSFQPHYIVSLGSSIAGDGQDSSLGAEALRFVRRQLEKINAPTLWVVGNRDLRSLTRTQFQELTDAPSAPYSIDYEDYRLIILDTNYNDKGEAFDAVNDISEHKRGAVSQEQLEWLKGELDTSKHVAVFMHHGAFSRSVEVGSKREKSISDAQILREVFALYNVSVVFTSHLRAHAYQEHRGVSYYSLESIKESKVDHPGAFYEVIMQNDDTAVSLNYVDKKGDRLVTQPYEQDAHIVVEE